MKQFLFISGIFLTFSGVYAQEFLEIRDNDSIETNDERHQLIIEFMSTLSFDTCADIGSGNMELILKIANAYNDKKFILEDIDSARCNKRNMIAKIEKLNLTRIDTNLISIQIGNTESTGLKEDQFDLILLSGLVHEIDNKDEFFNDIQRILKPSGKIIVSDAFYELPPKPHPGCTNRFLTNKEMEDLLSAQNLLIHKDWRRVGIATSSNGSYISRIMLCSFIIN